MFIKDKQLRIKVILVAVMIIFIFILGRIFYIQVFSYKKLNSLALSLWQRNLPITADRGRILDRNGKVLATNITTTTLYVVPNQIVDKESTARQLAEILNCDYDAMLAHITKRTSLEKVNPEGRQLDSETATKINDLNIDGLYLMKESKRYYPYEDVLSHVLGYVGIDNQGLSGLELKYNDYLTGKDGSIKYTSDGKGNKLKTSEVYEKAQNGMDIYLTIDIDIQLAVEKELENASSKYSPEQALSLVMDPNTGEVLAMGSRPTFDSNNYQEYDLEIINRNLPIWKNYEPGSTFKLITSSIGLEENITETDTSGDFTCNRSYFVNGVEIKCWDSVAHGSVSLRRALERSCNPSFIQLGQRIGKETFYKYLQAFGLLGKTGVRQPGEASGNFHAIDNCGPIELATMSFGQRFTITPLQLITAVSTCVNGGNLVQPRIVSKTVNTDTGVQTELPVVNVRQVISKSTSDKIKDMMESAVTVGTGKHAQVAGYSIGGKSGTSEPQPGREETDGYVASFIAISPTQNPEVIVLVILYHPRGSSHQGGAICAPVAGQILSEVLPHLGISATSSTSEKEDQLRMLNDVTGQTLTAARQTLESAGFKVVSRTTNNDASCVTSQSPKSGVSLLPGSVICLYTDGAEKLQSQVPDLKGMTADQAKNSLSAVNLNIAVTGSGKVVSQDVLAGSPVAEGSVITVTLQEEVVGGAQ